MPIDGSQEMGPFPRPSFLLAGKNEAGTDLDPGGPPPPPPLSSFGVQIAPSKQSRRGPECAGADPGGGL